MIDSNSQFFAILTVVGEAKQANATALGIPWTFKEMAVGDANGTDPIPDRIQKRLINEWRRAPVNQVRTDPANPNIIITEQVIPADVGGKWIREIALYDADGDMVAVANCAPSFKPLLAQGTGKTQIIRMNFIVTNTAQVVLKIDPAVVLATRDYVDTAIIDVLPPNKVVGSFRKVTINSRGVVQSGSNPTTLAEYGLDIPTQEEAEAQSGQNNTKPLTVLRMFQAIVKKLGLATQASITDATPGKLMTVGAGGLMSTVEPFQDANEVPYRTGFFGAAGANIFNCPPLAKSGDMVMQMVYNVNAAVQQWYSYSADVKYFRRKSVGVWSEWKEDVHTGNQSSSLPVGSMLPLPKGVVPPGFLEVDGSVQSAATYPDLFAYLGTTFNIGSEGAGNFRLPDSRGEFFRGWDHGRGVDAGRAIGSFQADETKSHVHTVNNSSATGNVSDSWVYGDKGNGITDYADLRTNPTGGGETRPRNLAVMWCIKAWNATVSQGNINVAALAALAVQAAETNQGTAKVATTAQMNAGLDDSAIATPKKLRFGFSISLAINGYLAFPSWLGGAIVQWGYVQGTLDDLTSLISFPMAFPSQCLNVSATADGGQSGAAAFVGAGAQKYSNVQFRLNGYGNGMATVGYHWWALGF